jgi:Leucine-rich repeat (LRR) protein
LPATHHPSKAEAQAVVRAFEETVRRSINKNEGVLTDANFASVKKLNLENHVIKDLTPLTKLSNLTDLKLSLFHVRDLTPLSKLKKLEKLSLYGCPSIDFKTVANLKQIKSLRLSKNQIRDLTPLAGLSNLEQFEMNEYQITDLGPLKKLRNLKEINLQSLRFRFRKKIADTKISKEQVESLKKALPNCRVLSDYDK